MVVKMKLLFPQTAQQDRNRVNTKQVSPFVPKAAETDAESVTKEGEYPDFRQFVSN